MLVHVLLVDLQDVVVDIHDSERDGNPVRAKRLELEVGHRAKGVLDQVESASGTLRLVLACTAYTSEEKPLRVVFTALFPGRRPQVSVAPVEARVPRGWQELHDLP